VGAAFFDYDNDGDLDLVTTALTPEEGGDELYQNDGRDGFSPVGQRLSLRAESRGRGLSFSDIDGDGDLDFFVADAQRSHFYRNNVAPTHWLQVELTGTVRNRYGLGARVELVAAGQPQFRELQSAFGYGSQVQPQAHFGLGTAAADTLWVTWPDGAESVEFGPWADQRLLLRHPDLMTGIEQTTESHPQVSRLLPNYPNPFNTRTVIRFTLARRTHAHLSIYNLGGQRIACLMNRTAEAGEHAVTWDGRNGERRRLASGVYLYRLRTGDGGQVEKSKLLLLR